MFFKITNIILIQAVCILQIFLYTGCATNNTNQPTIVGPSLSSSYLNEKEFNTDQLLPKIDVIIPVFDPGLPENGDYEDESIWPEIRRAEANRFAYKLKEKLEETGKFGAVRVTPDSTATGDLYILGKIKESNGEEVQIDVEVIDISNRKWLDESFDHEVSDTFYKNYRNKGKDPYDPLFEEVAIKITEKLSDQEHKELENLRYLADIRFGANLLDTQFMQYIKTENGQFKLVGKPSDQDPMFRRVKAIRVRDQLFIDGLQNNYASFSSKMNDSYLMWQNQSLQEIKAKRSANRKAIGQAIGGAALIGLGVLSAIAGSGSRSSATQTASTLGLLAGGVGGAVLIGKSLESNEEANMHRDTLNELGQSVDMELAPKVIEFDKNSVELTGNVKEQFKQWRNFLQRIYLEEGTPDLTL
ncbi:MAG: hypothetical protein CMH70_02615 [Nitrosomonadaceae bacterium]|nr:hypothetical protein [Nitrosomonadaceae bacterium]|tara:strand:- start:2114 stop:3358 length:1245 start_codon:yes stop_codon:yes gene_type:complete